MKTTVICENQFIKSTLSKNLTILEPILDDTGVKFIENLRFIVFTCINDVDAICPKLNRFEIGALGAALPNMKPSSMTILVHDDERHPLSLLSINNIVNPIQEMFYIREIVMDLLISMQHHNVISQNLTVQDLSNLLEECYARDLKEKLGTDDPFELFDKFFDPDE